MPDWGWAKKKCMEMTDEIFTVIVKHVKRIFKRALEKVSGHLSFEGVKWPSLYYVWRYVVPIPYCSREERSLPIVSTSVYETWNDWVHFPSLSTWGIRACLSTAASYLSILNNMHSLAAFLLSSKLFHWRSCVKLVLRSLFYIRLLNKVLNIDLEGRIEYRALHSFVEYSAEYRLGGWNLELYIRMLNIVLNIALECGI